jgi:hypothetical protein
MGRIFENGGSTSLQLVVKAHWPLALFKSEGSFCIYNPTLPLSVISFGVWNCLFRLQFEIYPKLTSTSAGPKCWCISTLFWRRPSAMSIWARCTCPPVVLKIFLAYLWVWCCFLSFFSQMVSLCFVSSHNTPELCEIVHTLPWREL